MTVELECAAFGAQRTQITIEAGARQKLEPSSATLIDRRVADLYPDLTLTNVIALDAGEAAKSFAILERVVRQLAASGLGRDATLAVVGGGTIGDLGGLTAALYLRGIAFVQMPTTLLAMVDSSVGGKTAINIPEGKNLVGSFWTPSRVWIDPEFIGTLDEADFRSGLGEVLKIAIGLDPELFAFCEHSRDAILARDPSALERLIAGALHAKISIVEADFRESGPRQRLNLGHTLGHAIEAASNFSLPHGVAVARGIHFALHVAERGALLGAADATRGRALLTNYEFAADALTDHRALESFIARDKKRSGAAIDFVVPTGVGSSTVQRLPLAEISAALASEL